MLILALFAYLIVGALAGLIGGMLGLSGGVVTVPCLIVLFHFLDFPQADLVHAAIGTSLAAMVINGLFSTIAHHKRGGVVWDIVIHMIPGIFLGCLLGAFVAHYLSGILLQILFGLFIALLGAYVLLQRKRKHNSQKLDKPFFTWVGLGIGFLSSLLGIGGGVFMVPFLLSHRFAETKAVGTSAATGMFITFIAALGYLYFGLGQVSYPLSLGYIYLPAFALIGATTIFFAPLGAKLAHQMKGKTLRRVFSAALILIGILMIFN